MAQPDDASAADIPAAPVPVRLTVDPAQVRYRLGGIGGNYCFNLESPVTRHTLDHLPVAAGRTEMSLLLWTPQNPGGDPGRFDYPPLAAAADRPGSRIRHELEIMRELSRRKIPYITSVWRLPLWMATVASPAPAGGRPKVKITEAQWPAVLQSIGTYLRYAKEQYQAEPDLFSFNEADIGVDVWLTPAEHCDAIKRLGATFQQLGLRTRCLLGDTGNARGTHRYVLPTVADPAAMSYVGAVSFHSWSGAKPAQYAAWADLAERLKLPLIVGEAGVDPEAWRKQDYQTFAYALREMVHYQELLLHARPQHILLWEFTGDYSLMASDRLERGQPIMTERFCLQKHWGDLTPPGSEALAASSPAPEVLITAFRRGADFTLHLSNRGPGRPVIIEGLPPELGRLQAVRTAKSEYYHSLPPVSVSRGRIELNLAGESLTSLTTLPITPPVPLEASR